MSTYSYLFWRILHMEDFGHIRHRLGIEQYLAHALYSFNLMNLVCSEPRGIYDSKVFKAEMCSLLRQLGGSADP